MFKILDIWKYLADLGVVKNQNMKQTNKYQIVHNHIKVPLSPSVD